MIFNLSLEQYGQNPTLMMGAIIFTLLLIAQITVQALTISKPHQDWRELKLRIRSWWIMVGFFFFSLIIHPNASLFLFGFLSFMALKEYFSLIHTRLSDHRALLWSYLAIPIQYYWIYIEWRAMVMIFIPVYMFLLIPFRLILAGETQGIINAMARIQWGLIAFVYCISHVASLLTLPANDVVTGGGRSLVLYLVFLTEINDVAQYLWGKTLGGKIFKEKIAPKVSPNKTWEGFLGGLFSTMTLAPCLSFLTGFPLPYAIASGFIIGVGGFIGDLVMSAVKRDSGVKDSSQLIPGHGGMLDRIDSLAYTAPLFYHFTNYFFFRVPW